MNRRGGILPAALFLTLATAGLGFLFVEIAIVLVAQSRAETVCDFALLSAMRVRRDSLESIASRWSIFGGDIHLDGSALGVAPERWSSVRSQADALRRALPGYQGRITSALTVSLDANGFPDDGSRAVSGTGLRLGLVAQTSPVLVGGAAGVLEGAWYGRGWRSGEQAPAFTDDATLTLEWPVPWRGESAMVRAASQARLSWDVDGSDPLVSAIGRGGFARTWMETIDSGDFSPHRFPLFRANLRTGGA